jgi:WD40 repeat protein
VSGSDDQTIRIWDAETGEEQAALKGHDDWVSSVAFSPDGKRVVSGSRDQTIRIWDAETGEEQAALKGHDRWVNSVAFSPDGKRVVSGSGDQTIRIWDAETGEEQAALKGHDRWVSSVAFSPDGKRVVSGSPVDITPIRYEAICANTSLQWKALDAQGWMLSFEDERLFWVPPQHRRGLCWPDTTVLTVIGFPKTMLNMEDFAHGEQWTRCYTGGKITTPDGHEQLATEESAHS